jgi:small-conductance mechanosensitive channel
MATTSTTIRKIFLFFALCVLQLPDPGIVAAAEAQKSAALATQSTAGRRADTSESDNPAEVRFMNRTIVVLHASVAGATPELRARRATELLERLNRSEWGQPIDTLDITIDKLPATGIRLGDHLLFVLVEADVAPGDVRGFDALAGDVRARLQEALIARSEFGRWPTFLRGVGFSLAATAILGGLIKLLIVARQRLQGRLQRLVERRMAQAGRSRSDWTHSALQVIGRILRVLMGGAVLTLMYGWLTFVLKQFVFTQPVGDRLSGFFIDLSIGIGQGVLDALPDLLTLSVIIFLTKTFRDLLGNFFDNVARGTLSLPGVHPDTVGATSRIASGLVWLLGLAFAYPYIPGSHTDVFKGLSVLAGLVLTLGSSSVVNQLMSGMTLVYSRSMRKGDLVRIGEVTGLVEEVNALSVKLVRVNEEITVPNAVVVGTTVRNYSRMSRNRNAVLNTTVTIGYDAPWRQVHALLDEAAALTPGIARSPAPLVLQRALSDFFVEYELQVTIANVSTYMETMSLLHANIQDRFNASGVQIMSPHFVWQPADPVVAPRQDRSECLHDKAS